MLKKMLCGLAAGMMLAGAGLAQEVVLRMHYFLPPNSFVPAQILLPWADRVEAQSGGRIKVERYDSMALGGKPADLVDQVTDGVVDVVWTLPGYTPGRFPHVEVVELPFMSRDGVATTKALWRMAQNWQDSDFKDLHLLGLWVHGPGVIHTDRPVGRVEDMAGLTLRTPSRAVSMLLEKLGAAPVGVPAPQVPESLAKHVISGALLPWEVTSSVRVAELVHNHTEFAGPGIYTAALMLAMNKDSYNRLPEDLRAVIDAASGEAFSVEAARLQQGADAPQREAAKARGNQLIVIEGEALAPWHKAGEQVAKEWAAAQSFDGAATLAEARDAIAKAGADPVQ